MQLLSRKSRSRATTAEIALDWTCPAGPGKNGCSPIGIALSPDSGVRASAECDEGRPSSHYFEVASPLIRQISSCLRRDTVELQPMSHTYAAARRYLMRGSLQLLPGCCGSAFKLVIADLQSSQLSFTFLGSQTGANHGASTTARTFRVAQIAVSAQEAPYHIHTMHCHPLPKTRARMHMIRGLRRVISGARTEKQRKSFSLPASGKESFSTSRKLCRLGVAGLLDREIAFSTLVKS